MEHEDIVAAWNAQTDKFNQWDNLSEEEKVEFAAECGHKAQATKVTVVDYDYCQLLPTDRTTVVSRKG